MSDSRGWASHGARQGFRRADSWNDGRVGRHPETVNPDLGITDSIAARVVFYGFCFGVTGAILALEQFGLIDELRSVFRTVLPSDWFVAGTTTGATNLRVAITLAVVGTAVILTLLRWAVATAMVRRGLPDVTWFLHLLTLLRALIIAEAVALFLWAGHLADPGKPTPIIASGEVPAFDVSRFLIYVVGPMALLLGILIGLTVRSTRRSLARAYRIAAGY